MHKIAAVLLIIFAIIFSFGGCRNDNNEIQSEFTLLISKNVDSENIDAIANFLDENISKMNEDIATLMVIDFREYLFNYIIQNKDKTILQELFVYIDGKTGRIDSEKIQNSEHKSYYDKIKAGSLMVMLYEDAPVLRVDHNKFLEKYGEYISDSVNELYRLEAQLIERPTSENAKLTVNWQELLKRAYAAEKLITEYSKDERVLADAIWIYTTHINSLLMGATNSPIFDYNTKEFSSSARSAYQDFILNEPDAVLTWVLKEYFAYLSNIDYTLDFNDCERNKMFFDTCDRLVAEAEKRVKE